MRFRVQYTASIVNCAGLILLVGVKAHGFSHLTAEMWLALAVTSLRGGRRKRASRTNLENRTANSRIRLACRFSIDSVVIRCETTPIAESPAALNTYEFWSFTHS